MKTSHYIAIAATLIVIFSVNFIVANETAKRYARPAIVEQPKIETSHDGMFFDVHNVVETFGYNDSAWYMVYDDADANMDYEVIRIDKRTHDKIVQAQTRRLELTGSLRITKPYESVEYALDVDHFGFV